MDFPKVQIMSTDLMKSKYIVDFNLYVLGKKIISLLTLNSHELKLQVNISDQVLSFICLV